MVQRLVALLLLLAVSAPVRAGFESFTEKDGLPSPMLSRFFWHERALLVGTPNGGFAQFDGLRFRTFDTTNGLPAETENMVHGFFETSDGALLLRCMGGLVTWDGGDGFSLDSPPSRTGSPVNVIDVVEHPQGTLWIATNQGVASKSGDSWQWVTALPQVLFMDLFLEPDGTIWAGTQFEGAFRFDGSGWLQYGNGVGFSSRWVWRIEGDSQGNVWLATPTGAVRYDGTDFRTFTGADGLAGDNVQHVLEDSRGNLWFSIGSFGITRWDGQSWESFGTADGIIHETVADLFEDPWGAIWIATGRGASRFDQSGWTHFRPSDGLAGSRTYAILEDSKGEVWVGGLRGVSRWNGSSWTTQSIVPVPPGSTSEAVLSIEEDAAGRYWFGTNNGIAMKMVDFWMYFRTADGLASNIVWDCFEDSQGRIWFGTDNGVSRLQPAVFAWKHYTTSDGLPDGWQFVDIAEDQTGRIWVAGTRAIARWDESTGWEAVPFEGGGGSAVEVAPDGAVWIAASNGAGLFRYDGGSWTRYTSNDGLLSNSLQDLLFDRSGALWISTDAGLNRLKDEVLGYYTFSEGGLPINSVDALAEDSKGALWIAGEGVIRRSHDLLAPVSVAVTIPPRDTASRLQTITWDAGFKDNDGTRFQTSFDGSPWSAPSTLRVWTMSGIDDGMHDLRVRGLDRIGNVEPLPLVVEFTVDGTAPLPTLSSPAFGEAVSGTASIVGTTEDLRFADFVVDVRPIRGAEWTTLSQSQQPVSDDVVAHWSTASFAEGEYQIRLRVTDSLGLVGTAVVQAIVDNLPPFANVTSPVRITPAGGEVFSTLGEVRAYFPPGAFEQEAVVYIDPSSPGEVPGQLPDGASLVWEGMHVRWEGQELARPGTLDLQHAGTGEAPNAYLQRSNGSWEYLGGSWDAETGTLSLPIEVPGLYALFAGGTGTSNFAPGLSAVSLTPRVLDGNNDQLTIAFSLDRPGPLSLAVFNRAGRLVRQVVDGTPYDVGLHAVRWDGRNENGEQVRNGLYLISIEAFGQRQTKALSVVR